MANANVTQDPRILENNLRALGAGSPDLARRIHEAPDRDDLAVTMGEDAAPGGAIRFNGRSLQLCSLRRPLEEAGRLAEALDPKAAAVAVVVGFGMGHHVRLLLERFKGQGHVVVFEPDLSLLRAVLSRVDHSAWIGAQNLRVHADGADPSAVSRALEGLEGFVSAGLKIIDHPPSRTRLGPAAGAFLSGLSTAVTTLRTHVITTLCQVEKTVGHHLANDVEQAKIASSQSGGMARLDLSYVDPGLGATLTAGDMAQQLQPLLARVVQCAHACVRQAGLVARGIDAVYLTGGSSALTPLRHALQAAFAGTPLVEGDLFGGVAAGLVYRAVR